MFSPILLFITPSIESALTDSDMILITDSKQYSKYGFKNNHPVYTPQGLTSFDMPFVIKKSAMNTLSKDDLGHNIEHSVKEFTDRSPKYKYEILDQNKDYFLINYHMDIKASTESFQIDMIPSIKGVSYDKYSWWNSSWNYYIPITIESDYVATDLSNFPVVVRINDTIGDKCDNGDSIRFVNLDNTTEYYYEIENFTDDQTRIVWVNLTSISSSSDTVFLMYYNNTEATDDQSASDVWNSGFEAVWHFDDPSGDINDSTSNSVTLSQRNTPAYEQTGQMGNCLGFDRDNDEYLEETGTFLDTPYNDLTMEAWAYRDDQDSVELVMGKCQGSNGLYLHYFEDGDYTYQTTSWMREEDLDSYTPAIINGVKETWFYFAGGYEGNVEAFHHRDTGHDVVAGMGLPGSDSTYPFTIGGLLDGGAVEWEFDGLIDEARVSSVVRNETWLNVTYHNQVNTAGFMTIGSQVQSLNISNFVPANGATDISTTTSELTFDILNSDDDVNWSVETVPDIGSDSDTDEGDGTVTVSISGLEYETTYVWYINATNGEITYNFTRTFTTSDDSTKPTSLTASSYTNTTITLTWTSGTDQNVIVRNTYDPTNATDGTEVYNGTATTVTDTGLTDNTRYYYRAYNWKDANHSSGYSSMNQYTRPQAPQSVSSDATIIDGQSIDLNISWTNGTGSDVTLVRRSESAQPTAVTYGTEVYNSSLPYTIDSGVTQVFYYTLWSYSNDSGLYSSAVNLTDFYVVWINCYNESSGIAIPTYGIFFTNEAGTQTYSESTCTNPHIVNVTNIPVGENIAVRANATGYDTKTYYFDITDTGNQYIDIFLSPTSKSDNYVIQVINELTQPIPNARVVVKRYVNGSYHNVTVDYTDGYGQMSISLVISALYKIDITKDGYQDLLNQNWQPQTINFVDDRYKTFQMIFEEQEYQNDTTYSEAIIFSGHVIGNTAYINYSDSLLQTINTSIYIYETNHSTNLVSLYYTNLTIDIDSFQFSFSINKSNTYVAVLHLNHTSFSYQTDYFILPGHPWSKNETVKTSKKEFDDLFTDVFGDNPFGWSAIFGIIVLMAGLFSFGQRNVGLSMIITGFIMLGFNAVIGLNLLNGSICIVIIALGILVQWKMDRRSG